MAQDRSYYVVPATRGTKKYCFRALMKAYPLHGKAPTEIVPSKVVKNLVEIEEWGHAMGRIPSWKNEGWQE